MGYVEHKSLSGHHYKLALHISGWQHQLPGFSMENKGLGENGGFRKVEDSTKKNPRDA